MAEVLFFYCQIFLKVWLCVMCMCSVFLVVQLIKYRDKKKPEHQNLRLRDKQLNPCKYICFKIISGKSKIKKLTSILYSNSSNGTLLPYASICLEERENEPDTFYQTCFIVLCVCRFPMKNISSTDMVNKSQ